jgi:hypothetical protein
MPTVIQPPLAVVHQTPCLHTRLHQTQRPPQLRNHLPSPPRGPARNTLPYVVALLLQFINIRSLIFRLLSKPLRLRSPKRLTHQP